MELKMKKKEFLILTTLLVLVVLGFSLRSPRTKQSELIHNIPDTPEAKEIMKTINKAYDIEAEAAYTFDLSKFFTVFINDARFPVTPGTLETVRQLTNNPSLESAGWLDYKLAFYSWRKNSILHSEAVHATAKAENRDLTDKEKKSLIDPYGRIAPAREENPIRKTSITFLSVEVNEDIATAVLDDGPATVQLTLVLLDKKWYIAAYKGLSIHP
jgi:hypothetical protein